MGVRGNIGERRASCDDITMIREEHWRNAGCKGMRHWCVYCSGGWVDVVLDIRPDYVLCALDDSGALMQQRASRLTVREHRHAAHDRLDGIRVDDAVLHTRDEERCLAAAEIVVQVDEEGEQTRLAGIRGRGVVLVRIGDGIDA